MVNKADGAYDDVQTRENCYGERPFALIHPQPPKGPGRYRNTLHDLSKRVSRLGSTSALCSRSTAVFSRSTCPRQGEYKKRPRSEDRGLCKLSRRRPTFPRSYPRSIIGPARLNFRVRDGNGCDPRGMTTGNS